jgi:hypothetical protein
MKHGAAMLALCTALLSGVALADCFTNSRGETLCGKGKCDIDEYGKVWCAEAGGDAVRDQHGKIVCGKGKCAMHTFDRTIWCSKEPGGGAAVDSYGNVKCLGGCDPGSKEMCSEGK